MFRAVERPSHRRQIRMNIETHETLAAKRGNALDRHDVDPAVARLADDPERVIGFGAPGVSFELFYRLFSQSGPT
jgi:hypothetical protein